MIKTAAIDAQLGQVVAGGGAVVGCSAPVGVENFICAFVKLADGALVYVDHGLGRIRAARIQKQRYAVGIENFTIQVGHNVFL